MLVVHDAGLTCTADGGPPPASPAPTCASVDHGLPRGLPPFAEGYVWKVYAAFPQSSSPRLKALCFGAIFPPEVTVLAGGAEDDVFELPTAGWPHYSGYGVMMSFLNRRTDTMVECYWLAGYGDGGEWQLIRHPTRMNVFVDDTVPPIVDQIMALGSIGFGEPGGTYCPDDVHIGACCFADGGCTILEEPVCTTSGAMFRGVGFACDPDPCRAGACCFGNDQCLVLDEEECALGFGLYLGDLEPCERFPCPLPTAFCIGMGCYLVPAWACANAGGWTLPDEPSCNPSPCQPAAACCLPDQTCTDIPPVQCEALGGTLHSGQYC